jgi:hypothetical protein
MKEFALIFRNNQNSGSRPTEEQMKEITISWMKWMGSIAAEDKLASSGSRLGVSGSKIVKPGNIVTEGPFTEAAEFITGYIVVKTKSVDEAVGIANDCPVLKVGGDVEIRPVVSPEDNS